MERILGAAALIAGISSDVWPGPVTPPRNDPTMGGAYTKRSDQDTIMGENGRQGLSVRWEERDNSQRLEKGSSIIDGSRMCIPLRLQQTRILAGALEIGTSASQRQLGRLHTQAG